MEKLAERLQKIRRDFHQNYAERSTQEFKTCKRIQEILKDYPAANVFPIGKTGVMAVFEGKGRGKTIMLRADTDALPIQETNDFAHKSIDPNVSHKCGHDGHTTILIGVAEMLQENPIEKGKIVLLWQPAEENGMGARAVLEDDKFAEIKPDQVFALHNLPGFPLHKIVYKKGAFTANVKSLIFDFNGKTAHAAEPEHGFNPAFAMAEILEKCKKMTHNEPKDENFFLITPVYADLGTKDYGISAGKASLHLTIRSWSPELFDQLTDELIREAEKICQRENLKLEISWTQEFFSNQNDEKAVEIIQNSAEELELNHQKINEPFKWGEDFGLFTQLIPGAMFGIGSGENCPALHNPDYDFPDEITLTASKLFYKILENAV
ncbi:amidohydrolase [Paenimyroides aestuarii]|uniref:Amidohydrolase n=1 Tax=Paenimyroides aestuarii TaxID=2968490 RepID=A0ABY5NRJ1_9FLAO|nr:amidohydrolase [Paenimyroides aestuarii]UUV21189.1 amidohydrolase [Paenimyroides aestuarii]